MILGLAADEHFDKNIVYHFHFTLRSSKPNQELQTGRYSVSLSEAFTDMLELGNSVLLLKLLAHQFLKFHNIT